ncbi:MAG: CRISPR system precrRNA processing endoribonuclease RAMP protein Cas6 [Campylobacterales bacterium]|nr:CRISPR system precrRNA processing endoribonuclease RAMP protein Cas6 [Campylobacterales bacterium]
MLKYIKIDIKITNNSLNLPKFIGSMIRGGFGVALKDTVCIYHKRKCDECFATSSCLYFDFYEKVNSFHEYRFEFEIEPKEFDFSIYLYGDSTKHTPYVLASLLKLCSDVGFGVNRIKEDIKQIFVNGNLVYENGKFGEMNYHILETEFNNYEENIKNVKIKLNSPIRIKQNNYLQKKDLDFLSVLTSIYHRYLELLKKPKERLNYEPKFEIIDKKLEFVDFQRYSNRKKTKMTLGGFMGEIILSEIDKTSYELLKIGEILGVGKSSVFGLGSIKITKGCS